MKNKNRWRNFSALSYVIRVERRRILVLIDKIEFSGYDGVVWESRGFLWFGNCDLRGCVWQFRGKSAWISDSSKLLDQSATSNVLMQCTRTSGDVSVKHWKLCFLRFYSGGWYCASRVISVATKRHTTPIIILLKNAYFKHWRFTSQISFSEFCMSVSIFHSFQ